MSAAAFRAAVEAWDVPALERALSPGVVLHSPVTHHPFVGRETVLGLLQLVAATFEDFRYIDELPGAELHGLVFRARVGDRELEGIDLLRLGADGLVADLTVMIRPLSGLVPFAQAMGEKARAAGITPTR